MRALYLVGLFTTALLACVAAAASTDATDANFNEVVQSAPLVLMEFYAPWCGHCKKLQPEWDAAADTLKKEGISAVLAKMDATVEKSTPEQFEVRGYPTIKIFRDGEVAGDYEGKRDAAGIVQWIKANSGPAITPAETAEQVDALKSDDLVLFVFYGAAEGVEYEAFEKVAKAQRSSYRFAVAPAAAGGDLAGKIVAYKSFDEKQEVFAGTVDATEITTFVINAGIRSFQEMGPDNYKQYIDRGLPIAWLFAKPGDEASTAAMAIFEKLAQEHKGKLSCVWVDATKYGGMAQRMSLKGTVFPAVVIDKMNKHYALDESQELTEEAVRAHFDGFAAGTLTQTIRSQDKPAVNPVKGLWTVVGHTFDELIANNKEDDLFVKFYAPWCGHCKTLAPKFDALAEKLAGAKGLKIAKFDASNNDFDNEFYHVNGYPTILFIKKGEATPINYEGDRTTEAMEEYLRAESSAEFGAEAAAEEKKDEKKADDANADL